MGIRHFARPLGVALAVSMLAVPAPAEIQIRLKDGRVITLPYTADDVDSITFKDAPKKAADSKPNLPPAGEIVNKPMPKGQVGAKGEPRAVPGQTGDAQPDASDQVLKNWGDIKSAVASAQAGQTITIQPGTYILRRRSVLGLSANGTAERPITLRAEKLGSVTIEVEFREATRITGSHWIIENLEFIGICGTHSHCEHVFHLKPNSHHITIRNNRMIDFNAAIKGSAKDAEGKTGPSSISVEGNWIYNKTPRRTKTPVTPIDVNGGRNWVVRSNYIADFEKAGGNKISYGAFLKRDSYDGLFEGNLIVCEQRHSGGIRVGLSLGGGGSGQPVEHTNGTIRNNIVMNCPRDVGLYLNRARNTRVYNNVFFNTVGIDVRYRQSTADLRNNIISGRIKNRSSGSHVSKGDRVGVGYKEAERWFVNPRRGDFRPRPGAPVIGAGVEAPGVVQDFCGRERSQPLDQGAIAASDAPCEALKSLWVDSTD